MLQEADNYLLVAEKYQRILLGLIISLFSRIGWKASSNPKNIKGCILFNKKTVFSFTANDKLYNEQ